MLGPEEPDLLDYITAQLAGADDDLWESPIALPRLDYMPALTLGLAERYVDIIEHKETTP